MIDEANRSQPAVAFAGRAAGYNIMTPGTHIGSLPARRGGRCG